MKTLHLIGLGTGNENFLTKEAESILKNAEIIFGAKRILEIAGNSLSQSQSVGRQAETSENSGENLPKTEPLYRAEEIFSYLKENPQYQNVAIVFSGDVGFFSGASAFYEQQTEEWEIRVIPGISSAVYFAAKLQKSWQNWKFLSLHGSKCNTIEQIRKNPACFFILSGAEDVKSLAEKIQKAVKNKILSEIKCWLGKNLSYNDEKITCCKFSKGEESACQFDFSQGKAQNDKGLFVLLVENECAKYQPVTPSLNDEDFIRTEKIPMTKKEVRRLSLATLGLSESSVLYDIGSGTGSVTVEAARIATEGHVFAVECKKEAFELTKKNVEKFCLENVTPILGNAPECLKADGNSEVSKEIPAPTHVFIGGSKGNLSEIVNFSLQKNPRARIVANFVSLENLCEMQSLLKNLESENKIKDVEIIQVAVSHAEKTGGFHLMKAQNPVYIVGFSGS